MRNQYFVIDSHCHIYPDRLADKASQNISDFYDGIPHIPGSVSELLHQMEGQGIDRSVVNSAAMSAHQVSGINRFIAETVSEYSDKFFGLGTLHPDMSSNAIASEISFLKEHGLKGIKIHPDMLGISVDDQSLSPIYTACGEADLVVLLHTGDRRYDYSNPNRMETVLASNPNTTFVGGHFSGRDFYLDASEKLSSFGNLYCDCSSSFLWLSVEEALQCIRNFGTDKVMFGTDFPICKPGFDLDYFFRLPLSDYEREQILSENAIRVFGLEV